MQTRTLELFPTQVIEHQSLLDLKDTIEETFEREQAQWQEQPVRTQGPRSGRFEQSNYLLHRDEAYAELTTVIHELSHTYADSMGWAYYPEITQMWANRFTPGVATHPHYHSNSLLSIVYYAQTAPGTVFCRPTPSFGSNWPETVPRVAGNAAALQSEWVSRGIKGTIVMFPSCIQHWSLPSDETRLTISANLHLTHLGNPGTLVQCPHQVEKHHPRNT